MVINTLLTKFTQQKKKKTQQNTCTQNDVNDLIRRQWMQHFDGDFDNNWTRTCHLLPFHRILNLAEGFIEIRIVFRHPDRTFSQIPKLLKKIKKFCIFLTSVLYLILRL